MHKKHIELNNLREDVRKSTKQLNLQKITLLSKVDARINEMLIGYGDSNLTSINFDDLSLLEVGIRNEISEGVFFEKTYGDDDKIVLLTYMQKGGSFGVHSHDCVELVKILKGNLIERERGYKNYNKGEMVIYAPNEVHRPYATEDSLYEVFFYKDLLK
jgi:hypothetical protein